MSVFYTISYTLAHLLMKHKLLVIGGGMVFLILTLWIRKKWRSKERIYRRKAAHIRRQQRQVEEWQNYFRQLHNRK